MLLPLLLLLGLEAYKIGVDDSLGNHIRLMLSWLLIGDHELPCHYTLQHFVSARAGRVTSSFCCRRCAPCCPPAASLRAAWPPASLVRASTSVPATLEAREAGEQALQSLVAE